MHHTRISSVFVVIEIEITRHDELSSKNGQASGVVLNNSILSWFYCFRSVTDSRGFPYWMNQRPYNKNEAITKFIDKPIFTYSDMHIALCIACDRMSNTKVHPLHHMQSAKWIGFGVLYFDWTAVILRGNVGFCYVTICMLASINQQKLQSVIKETT